jgi:hypothetical protein
MTTDATLRRLSESLVTEHEPAAPVTQVSPAPRLHVADTVALATASPFGPRTWIVTVAFQVFDVLPRVYASGVTTCMVGVGGTAAAQ